MSATAGSEGGAAQEEEKKPMDQHIISKSRDGNEVFFRIKRSTQLRKLMTAYCDRQSVEFNAIAFLFDGRRLRAEQTPDELEMEDGDEIDRNGKLDYTIACLVLKHYRESYIMVKKHGCKASFLLGTFVQ